MSAITVAALYHFVTLENHTELQAPLLTLCKNHQIFGTLLLAAEGINGTIAGPAAGIEAVLASLRTLPAFANLSAKLSYCDENPFYRMKVKLKQEIVTLGVTDLDPAATGEYVNPQDWNALLQDPEVVVIDTRNDYEVAIGQFKGAVDPNTQTFREFPEFVAQGLKDVPKNKKIAMYCTGGIRCEKSTAYLKQQGYEHVFHLKGGILKYLEDIPPEQSLWQGECFVFDNRVAVNHNLQPGSYDQCYGCRYPITDADKQSNDYVAGVHCPRCVNTRTPLQKQRARDRQLQMHLAQQRQVPHLGAPQPQPEQD